jgi:hypothetical protein
MNYYSETTILALFMMPKSEVYHFIWNDVENRLLTLLGRLVKD